MSSRTLPPFTISLHHLFLTALSLTVVAVAATAAASPSATVLVASPNSPAPAEVVTLTATVSISPASVLMGFVDFFDNTVPLGTASLLNSGGLNTATLRTNSLGLGGHSLTAKYRGTPYGAVASLASTSDAVPMTIAGVALPSGTQLQYVPNPTNPNAFDLTATVSSALPPGPSGSVSFTDTTTGHVLGTATLQPSSRVYLLTPSPDVNIPSDASVSTALVAGDLNNDGALDFVLVNALSQTMTAYLGDPAHPGTFTAQPSRAIPILATPSLTLGDLNGDGYLDVILSTQTVDYTYFADPAHPGTYVVGDTLATLDTIFHTDSVVVADVNLDGILDLVVGTVQWGVFIYLGDPSHPGHFLPPSEINVPTSPNGVKVADFNLDGLPDILGEGDPWLNDPQHPGQFLAPTRLYGTYLNTIMTPDLNGDGVPDYLRVAGGIGWGPFLQVGIGDPLTPEIVYNFTNYTVPYVSDFNQLRLVDLNRDGLPDIVFPVNGQIFFGDPANPGKFLPAISPLCLDANNCALGTGVAIGDFNGDGLPDFLQVAGDHVNLVFSGFAFKSQGVLRNITLEQAGSNTLTANYGGDSLNAASAAAGLTAIQPLQTTVVLAAMNSQNYVAGHGAIQLTATVTQGGSSVPTGRVEFRDGKFSLGSAGVSSGVAAFSTATLGPGTHSLTAVYGGALRSAQPYGPGVSAPVSVSVGPDPSAFAVVGAEGSEDFPPSYFISDVTGFGNSLPTGNVTVIDRVSGKPLSTTSLANASSSSFGSPLQYEIDPTRGRPVLFDINGDGVLDFIAAGAASSIEVLLGDNTHPGHFRSDARSYGANAPGNGVAIADFNGDGLPDIATLISGAPMSIGLFFNDPLHQGSFLIGGNIPLFQNADQIAEDILEADVNGDGLPDLIAVGSQSIMVLLNDPTQPGAFLAQSPISFQANIYDVHVADLNQDGMPDIVFSSANPPGPAITILYGDTQHPGQFTSTQTLPVTQEQNLNISVADFNGDGFPDLAYLLNRQMYLMLSDVTHPGRLGPSVTIALAYIPSPVFASVGDFNHDGLADLIFYGPQWSVPTLDSRYALGVTEMLSDPVHPGQFLPPVTLTLPNLELLPFLAADLNGDGLLDFVADLGHGARVFLQGHAADIDIPLSLDFSGAQSQQSLTFQYSGDVTYPPSNTAVVAFYANCYLLGSNQPNISLTPDATRVIAAQDCGQTASSDESWLTLVDNRLTAGLPFGNTTFIASANITGSTRSAHISFDGKPIATVTQAFTIPQFADVPQSAGYFDAANLMFEAGVTAGCASGSDSATRLFCPDSSVTRQEMAAFIVRAVTGTTTPAIYNPVPYFTDVPKTNPFFPHIQKLVELGITVGCGNQQYCPTAAIPRWQMAIFMVRARLESHGAVFPTSTTPYFADVPTTVEGNATTFPYIQRAYEEHLTIGCGTNPLIYCPDQLVTRGQMASFIMRGLFNETTILGPSDPQLSGASPNTIAATAGTQIRVTITGANTTFGALDTLTVPSGMLNVSNVVVNSATSISATLTTNGATSAGPQSLVVSSGGRRLTLPLAIKVGTY
jgi:hypothetical protein